MKLTHERLLEVLSYEPETGLFRWKVKIAKQTIVGEVTSQRPNAQGYLRIRIDVELFLAHRLAVFYMTGSWPEATVDHRHRDRTNNRWDEIRPASYSQNGANKAICARNTSGFKGVSWNADCQCWQAHIMVNKKSMYLGLFENPEDAAEAYMAAAVEHFGEFARAA